MYRNHFNACAKAASSQFSYEQCEFLYKKGLLRTTMSHVEGRRELEKYKEFAAEFPPFDVATATSKKARMHYNCNLKNDFLRSTGRRTTGPSSVMVHKLKNNITANSLPTVECACCHTCPRMDRAGTKVVSIMQQTKFWSLSQRPNTAPGLRAHIRCFFQERRQILP